jgi:hypothetical protein
LGNIPQEVLAVKPELFEVIGNLVAPIGVAISQA